MAIASFCHIFIFFFKRRGVIKFVENLIEKLSINNAKIAFGNNSISLSRSLDVTEVELEKANESLESVNDVENDNTTDFGEHFDEEFPIDIFNELYKSSGPYAIYDQWNAVRIELDSVKSIIESNGSEKIHDAPIEISKYLLDKNLISKPAYNSIVELYGIKNNILDYYFDNDFTYEEALRYRNLCKNIYSILHSVQIKLKN